MTDLEIQKQAKLENIDKIVKKLKIDDKYIEQYGKYKAKISNEYMNNLKDKKDGKLVLLTAINPTPLGEGKTTMAIGLADALNRIGKDAILALREPSMGPVFGIKGGATGGGYAQIAPMEDINLHFTGDFHAITSANNLICAAIDNHIYFGNELDIQEVTFHRCLDVNDRALRDVDLGTRHDSFSISSASEIMALFCLATSLEDLRERLGNIIVGINSKKEFVTVRDLKVEGSLVALLKDAFYPNLVQTLENTPAIIHGGPFANIAHGCNSIVGTKTALSLADYVVTEAGFGADLGAEKFLNIKCRVGNLSPEAVVLVCTVKALKYHGGVPKDNIFDENMEAFKEGFANLDRHYENLKKFGVSVVVCLNRYNTDTEEEVEYFKKYCEEKGYVSAVSTAYVDGSEGAMDLANKVLSLDKSDYHALYSLDNSIEDKIKCICSEIYRASKVHISEEIKEKIRIFEKNGKANLPVCVAKTQYSFSDDAKKLGAPENFEVTVKDIRLYGGANFITVLLGDIMVMPGLSRKPNFEIIDVVDGEIVNLS